MSTALAASPTIQRDLSLVLQVQKGDVKALGKLYDVHAPTLLGLIRSVTGNSELSEEVLQNVFMEIYARSREFDSEVDCPSVWITELARTAAIAAVNGAKEVESPPIQTDRNNVSELAEPDSYSAMTTNNTVNTTLLLDLIRIKKISLPQAALELGITINEIKIRLRAELKQFRKGNSNA